jgi:hypothetical protein
MASTPLKSIAATGGHGSKASFQLLRMRGTDQQQTECGKKTAVIKTIQRRALLQVDRHFGTRQQGVRDERVPRGAGFACIASIRGPVNSPWDRRIKCARARPGSSRLIIFSVGGWGLSQIPRLCLIEALQATTSVRSYEILKHSFLRREVARAPNACCRKPAQENHLRNCYEPKKVKGPNFLGCGNLPTHAQRSAKQHVQKKP